MKIYQVEVSNFCNLKCNYCPHPIQKREKGNMSFDTFKKVIELTKKCKQNQLYLHNFGEPLLNPLLENFIIYANENGIECSFYTNGIGLSSKRLLSLCNAGLKKISISNHTPNADIKVKKIINKLNLPIQIEDVYTSVIHHNWAGQISSKNCEYICNKSLEPCIFERKNAFVVLWNGDISACCLDCNGVSVKCSISDLLKDEYQFSRFCLCDSCDLMRGEELL